MTYEVYKLGMHSVVITYVRSLTSSNFPSLFHWGPIGLDVLHCIQQENHIVILLGIQ